MKVAVNPRLEQIEIALRALLPIENLSIDDDSALHAGHVGASSGGGHFRLQIISSAFEGKTRLERHRLVYDALRFLMASDIHALAIEARTPGELFSS